LTNADGKGVFQWLDEGLYRIQANKWKKRIKTVEMSKLLPVGLYNGNCNSQGSAGNHN
jgi:hypothetical protein